MLGEIGFISDEDIDEYRHLRGSCFGINVAVHGMIGHGCGKLLTESETGTFNFDSENPPINH